MSTSELKAEMHKAINQIPEDVSEDVLQEELNRLENIITSAAKKLNRLKNFSKILAEDDEVFRKLAQ